MAVQQSLDGLHELPLQGLWSMALNTAGGLVQPWKSCRGNGQIGQPPKVNEERAVLP
jgi:hypothetical protein